MEMERGIVQVQEHSTQHRAKMWKVRRSMTGVGPHMLKITVNSNFKKWIIYNVQDIVYEYELKPEMLLLLESTR